MKKILTVLFFTVLVVAVAGAYYFPKAALLPAGSTAQGATGLHAFQANVFGVALATPGANATSTSVLNTSTNTYYITSIKIGCSSVGTSQTAYTGAGLAQLLLSVATTSTAAPATPPTTNLVGGGTTVIGTSTAQFTMASSSAANGGNASINNIWPSGSYLTFSTNATNTATCTFGVDYFSA